MLQLVPKFANSFLDWLVYLIETMQLNITFNRNKKSFLNITGTPPL